MHYNKKGLGKKMKIIADEGFKLLIQNSNDCICLIDAQGRQIYINEKVVEITGYSVEELLGPFEKVIFPEDLNLVAEAWQKVVSSNELVRVQYRHIHKTRGHVWMEAVGQNHISNPSIKAVVVNVRDITLQKEAEEIILEKNNELKQLLELRKQELTTHALILTQMNTFHSRIMKELKMLQKGKNSNELINQMISDINSSMGLIDWKEFQRRFEDLQQDFCNQLSKKYPDLSPAELKLTAFLRLGFTSKEISALTSNTQESIHVARSRLRSKLGLSKSENLSLFINAL